MKLGTDIHHMSGHCWKGFKVQRSRVKIIARSRFFSHGAIFRYSVEEFQRNLAHVFIMQVDVAEKVFKVKGQMSRS